LELERLTGVSLGEKDDVTVLSNRPAEKVAAKVDFLLPSLFAVTILIAVSCCGQSRRVAARIFFAKVFPHLPAASVVSNNVVWAATASQRRCGEAVIGGRANS
jgi:hypothetical protein